MGLELLDYSGFLRNSTHHAYLWKRFKGLHKVL